MLAAFPERLSAAAKRALERLGVEVRLETMVTASDAAGVTMGEERIARPHASSGPPASPPRRPRAGSAAEKDRAGRVKVEPDLSLPGHPEIFVIGDTAAATDAAGQPLPGIAPAAKQAGSYVAKVIRARVRGRKAPGPFRYRDLGNLATIGRKAAVADFGRIRLSGFLAWLALGPRPHLLPDRLPQPARGRARLVLGLPHLPARRPPDHRPGRVTEKCGDAVKQLTS